MKKVQILVFLISAIVGPQGAPAALGGIISDFEGGAGGWTVGGGTSSWQPSGGNTGAYALAVDMFNGPPTLTAYAPSKFTGDLSAYNGGTFSFDSILLSGEGDFDPKFGRVKILSGSDSATLDLATSDPTASWMTYAAPLSATAWGVTESLWSSILSDVTGLEITLESKKKSGEQMGLDNVQFEAPAAVPEPGGIVTMGIGLLGLAIRARCRRRRSVA